MKKTQLYFSHVDSERCYALSVHLEEAEEQELTEITLFSAVKSDDKDSFFCKELQSVGLRREGFCGSKVCSAYKPRNRKSGICTHLTHTYEKGGQVTFAKHHAHWVQVSSSK